MRAFNFSKKDRRHSKHRYRAYSIVGTVVGVMVFWVFWQWAQQSNHLKKEEAALWPLSEQLTSKKQQWDDVQNKISEQENSVRQQQRLVKNQLLREEILWLTKFIGEVMPDSLSLTHMSLSPDNMVLTGVAKDVAAIEQFVSALTHWDKLSQQAHLILLYQSNEGFCFEVSLG